MILKNITMLISLFVSLSLTGCISEDLEGCIINTTKVNFKYLANGDQDVILKYVDHLTVFIYDKSTGDLFETREITLDDKSKTKMELKHLPGGTYSFVVWGNLSSYSEVGGIGNIGQGVINQVSGGKGLKSSDRLYFSRGDVHIKEISNNSVDLLLKSAHVKFDVTVKGLAEMPSLHISHQVQGFDMNMNIIEGDLVGFNPVLEKSDKPNLFRGQFNVLRPQAGFLESKLTMTTSTLERHEVSLKDFIAMHYPQISMSKTQEIKIEVLFEFSNLGINVTVPNWDVDDNTGSVID